VSIVGRGIVQELNKLIDRRVEVRLVDGKTYVGTLLGYDQSSLHIILGDAESSDGRKVHRVIITGPRISEILVVEKPLFDAEEFRNYLIERLNLPPGSVRVIPEINAVTIYERIKVTESGVEGAGSLAQKVFDIYQEYIARKKRSA